MGDPQGYIQEWTQCETELYLLIVRKQQLKRIKDDKAVVGEHARTHHMSVVFVMCKLKMRKAKSMDRKTIMRWKFKDNVVRKSMWRG